MGASPWSVCVLATLLASQAAWADGKRVVMFPVPFTSHGIYHSNVARALVELGHEVWFLVADYILEKGVLNTTGCNVLRYTTIPFMDESMLVDLRDAYFEKRPPVVDRILQMSKQHVHALMTNEALTSTLRDLRLDMMVIDNILSVKALAVLPYRLGIPFAFLGTYYDPMASRVPFAPPVTPFPLMPFSDRMDFLERVQTTCLYALYWLHDPCTDTDAVSRYAPDMPQLSVDAVVARADLWLVETDHILDYPRPSLPNVKLIGGTATGPAKPLPASFRSFMDGAPQGVVVVSFGSCVLGLPEDISAKMFKALSRLPFRSVFRSNLTSPDPDKILTSPWLPQNDLMGHAHTTVFVSHCGKNGQYEALFHVVPVVCMPIFSDQPYNAERMRRKGMSETLDLNTVSEEELEATIVKVGTEKRYKQAISAASNLFHIEFGVPKERAAFWLDHVMKHGSAHMRSAGQDMPYYQLLGLDIMAMFVTLLLVALFVLVLCLRLACRLVCCRGSKQKSE